MRFSSFAVPVALRLGAPIALVLVLVALARAGLPSVPSRDNSTVPSCLITTPGGYIETTILVHDLNNLPINNSFVIIDYSGCTGFVLAPPSGSDGYTRPYSGAIGRFTDVGGHVTFKVRAGGGCVTSDVKVSADGIFIGSMRAASADQTGNLVVDNTDVGLVVAKEGTPDLTGDLDCNGVVNEQDWWIAGAYSTVEVPVAGSGDVALAVAPNPAHRATMVIWTQRDAGRVDLAIRDVVGRRVRTLLASADRSAGRQFVPWDGRDDAGLAVRPGMYWAVLRAPSLQSARSVILMP